MRRALVAACAMVLPLAAGLSALPAAAQTLKIGLREDPDILDPATGGSYVGRIVFAGMCDKLFDYNTKLEIVPQLATSYEYKDPTHLIIHLRKGVTFQDGEKFDANSVKYTLIRDKTMKRSLRKGQLNLLKQIEVINPLTVELILSAPDSPLVAQLAGRPGIIVAPEVAKKEGAKFGLHPVCAGPFSFVNRVPEQKIVLKRYPGYWDESAIHFDRLVYIPLVSAAVRLANLQSGAIDLDEHVIPTNVPTVKKDPKLKMAIKWSPGYEGITFNVGRGPKAKSPIGESADLREAFNRSINRKALIQVVYDGLYTPIAQANPPGSPFNVPSIKPLPRNISLARKLVAKSGYKPPVTVDMIVPNSPALLQAAQVIQAMVRPAGFNLKLEAMEFASSLARGHAGDFQVYMIGWSGRADADSNMYSFLYTGRGFNFGGYSDPTVDKLLNEARDYTSVAKRNAIYEKVWLQVRTTTPLIYLWALKNTVGMQKNLMGFRQVPDGIIRVQGMHLAK
ncbi:MAG: ABC transporter substrate-binding protein [Acetobacteraceae bacterium]